MRESDVVVLCVKPIDVERVLREVSDLITPSKAIASVAAGVRTATLETILDVDAPVFRFMPNVGVQVGMGTLAYSAGRFIDTKAEQTVLGAFSMLGEIVPLEERQFDAATALSGSGPAFLGLIVEAFEDAGIVSGLSYADARRLILLYVGGHKGREPRYSRRSPIPIYSPGASWPAPNQRCRARRSAMRTSATTTRRPPATTRSGRSTMASSEERRVGKECYQPCRSRWSPYH